MSAAFAIPFTHGSCVIGRCTSQVAGGRQCVNSSKHTAGKLCRNSASSVGGVSTITGGVPAGKPAKETRHHDVVAETLI